MPNKGSFTSRGISLTNRNQNANINPDKDHMKPEFIQYVMTKIKDTDLIDIDKREL